MSTIFQKLKLFLPMTSMLLISSLAYTQSVSRDSPDLPEISEPIVTLDHATGWFKDAVGEWYSNDRAIGYDHLKKIDYGIEDYDRSKLDNFTHIELRTFTYKGKRLNALLRHSTIGSYLYPSISQDWRTDNAIDFCAVENSDLGQVIKALTKNETAQRISLNCIYSESVNDKPVYNDSMMQQIVASVVSQQKDKDFGGPFDTLCIDVFPVEYEGENLVRFNWNEKDILFHDYPFEPSSFDQSYYEVDFDSFAALFNPN